MNKTRAGIGVAGILFGGALAAAAVPIHVTHLWHMHQPIYYPYESPGTIDSNGRFNFSVQGVWDGDRVQCYQNWPAGAVAKASGHGASQMSYSGSLAENNKSLWGDYSGWGGNVRNARNNLKTSSGNSRLDLVGIAYHHSLMPLTSVESMRMQIKLHKEQYKEAWATGGAYSKGFWPPECAFDNSMVPALVAEGLEWVIVDNGHLFRTAEDFAWSSASSCRPNKADVRNGSSTNLASTWVTLPNVWAPTKVLAPWSYQPHYVRHVDPASGVVRKIIAVPAGRYEGNENGRGGYGAFKPENVWGGQIAANNDPSKPMLLLLHSDGDNYGMKNSDAWNGQHQAFVDMCNGNADFEYTGVQDYLSMYPPNPNDVIHVEPGSWIGIDGGTPYYEKWLSYENRSGEMPDMWSWSVLVAAQNRVFTADDMENSYLSGGKDMNDVEWGLGNDTAKAWHYYLNGETSCYWYWDYDTANPWDGNPTRACNLAIAEANKVIARNPSGDNRGPSIFPPQRTPYNPGGKMWNETSNAPSDFVVWTFIDDLSGVQSATLKWRRDLDGQWPISSTENETFAGGSGVTAWQSVAMADDYWPANKGSNVPDPANRAKRYRGTITNQSECLIDYYVEAVDNNGKTNRSNILHVWVGEQTGGTGGTNVPPPDVWLRGTHTWPAAADVTDADPIYFNVEAGPSGTVTSVTLGYYLNGNGWIRTNMAVNTNWGSVGGRWYNHQLGPFAAGDVLNYYVEATDGSTTNWDNNGGANYHIEVAASGGDSDVLWVGNVAQAPANGAIAATNPIVVACESWPIGASTNVALVFTANGGATWGTTNFAKTGEAHNNDLWSVAIGPYPDGTTVKYCVSGTLPNGTTVWDNNGGDDYEALVGALAAFRIVRHAPEIGASGAPDNAGDAFDFDTSGGAATTSGGSGFGSFGQIYVNCDDTNLYVGGTGVALPNDSQNNAYVVFLSTDTAAGAADLRALNGNPLGLDYLHNVTFQEPAFVAIQLGDVWGDGANYPNFNMYKGDGFNWGQGVWYVGGGATTFSSVNNAKLSQFVGYGPDSRLAANWECSLPLWTLGVTNAAALTNLYLSGLIVNFNPVDNAQYVSGHYLGDGATITNAMPGSGNFEYNVVRLAGMRVAPPAGGADETHGVPNSWISERLPGWTFTADSNKDGDTHRDRDEYFLGTDPDAADDLRIEEWIGARMRLRKVGGQMCAYVLETADHLDSSASNWNWTSRGTLPSTNGEISLPAFTASNLLIRVKIDVPE